MDSLDSNDFCFSVNYSGHIKVKFKWSKFATAIDESYANEMFPSKNFKCDALLEVSHI